MKLRAAVTVSILLHLSLALIAIFTPLQKRSGETTYYVDLIQTGSSGGGRPPVGSGEKSGGQPLISGPGASLVQPLAGKMKDLKVSDAPKSSLHYPDAEGKKKREEEKLISIVRKEPATNTSTPANASTAATGLTMGISTGASVAGNGSGDGSGNSAGGLGTYFPYAYYVESLKGKISSSWYNSLVSPGLKGKYLTSVYFKINRNGEISELKIENSSGIDSLDLSALRAVSNAAPFAPLPADFPYSILTVHFEFEWEK